MTQLNQYLFILISHMVTNMPIRCRTIILLSMVRWWCHDGVCVDKSIWSPQLLVSWLTANRPRFQLLQALQENNDSGSVSTNAKDERGYSMIEMLYVSNSKLLFAQKPKKKLPLPKQKSADSDTKSSSVATSGSETKRTTVATTTASGSKSAIAAAAAAEAALAATQMREEVWPDTPFVIESEDVRLTNQAIDHLSRSIHFDLLGHVHAHLQQQQHMDTTFDVTAAAALSLANIYGTSRPLDAALLLSLHISAQLRGYGHMLFREAAAHGNPESLVMQRHSLLASYSNIDSKESKTINKYVIITLIINSCLPVI
jgi:hypothetical protein